MFGRCGRLSCLQRGVLRFDELKIAPKSRLGKGGIDHEKLMGL